MWLFALLHAIFALWCVLHVRLWTRGCDKASMSSHLKSQGKPAAKCHFDNQRHIYWCVPLTLFLWSTTWGSCQGQTLSQARSKKIISLCLLHVLDVVAAPLAVQLAQISHPTACREVAVGGVNVVTPQRVQIPVIFSLRLLVGHGS